MLLKKSDEDVCKKRIAAYLPRLLKEQEIFLSSISYLQLLSIINKQIDAHIVTSWNKFIPMIFTFKISIPYACKNSDLKAISKTKLNNISNKLVENILHYHRDTDAEARLNMLQQQILVGVKHGLVIMLGLLRTYGAKILFRNSQQLENTVRLENQEIDKAGFIYVLFGAPILEEFLFRRFIADALTHIKKHFTLNMAEALPVRMKQLLDPVSKSLSRLDGPTVPITSMIGSAALFAIAHPQYKQTGMFFKGMHYAYLRNENNGSIVPSTIAHMTHNVISYANTKIAKQFILS